MTQNTEILEQAYAHCAQITKDSDSNFALGFKFLPTQKRNAIYAVYAFNRLADDFVDEDVEGVDKREAILKWESLLEACYRGEKSTHPVIIAFSDTVNRYKIPIDPFKEAIEGFKMDLTKNKYKNFEELSLYCDRVAGTISTMSLHIFGWDNDLAIEYGKNLSYALQLTNIIRDVGTDIEKNRIYLPQEELKAFNYTEELLKNRVYNDDYYKMMDFQIHRARSYFEKADPLIKTVHKDSQYTVTMIGAVYAELLKKIKSNNIPSLTETISLSSSEKARLAVRMLFKPTFIA